MSDLREGGINVSERIKMLFSKARGNHLFIMAVSCLIPLGLLYTTVHVFGADMNSLFVLFVLLCPLMHFLMMRKH
jgi:hypothetical protein